MLAGFLPEIGCGCLQIVKVLHGSNWDVLWLQRDFGIYVVNLFDTGQAARVLNFPGLGYAFLLEKFCGVKVSHHRLLGGCLVKFASSL